MLSGLQPDLYRCFMERAWRSMASRGVVGLIHPDSHFTELRAKDLRRYAYRRLRRHFKFHNNTYQFPEIGHKKTFGIHVYGDESDVSFLHASWIFAPSVVDRSLVHDGSGPAPGMKDVDDNWDLRPHRERIMRVDESILANWAVLIDEPGTPAGEARMLYPVNRASAEVLNKLAAAPRLGSIGFEWTPGWHEPGDRKKGLYKSRVGCA